MSWRNRVIVSACLTLAVAGTARAQPASQPNEWKVNVYPVLGWVPTSIGIDVNLPPLPGGGGGGGNGGGGTGGQDVSIIDSRFDAAFLAGVTASNGVWRIEADGVFVAIGGDRVDLPRLTVDVNVIYGRGLVGRRVAKDFYVTAGLRRFALKYDIEVENVAEVTRKPGIWDPLVGVGYHHVGDTFEVHGALEGGGFGVGADVDLGGSFRVDWKPTTHFGLTAGYSLLYFKFEHDLAHRTLAAKTTLHGPVVGVGLYF